MKFLDLDITNGTESIYNKYREYLKNSDYGGYQVMETLGRSIFPFFIKDNILTHLFSNYDGDIWQKTIILIDKLNKITISELSDFFDPYFRKGAYFENILDKSQYDKNPETYTFLFHGEKKNGLYVGDFVGKKTTGLKINGTFKLRKI